MGNICRQFIENYNFKYINALKIFYLGLEWRQNVTYNYELFVTDKCGEVSNSPVSFLWIVGFSLPVENENLKVSSLAVVFALPLADMVLAPQNSSTIFSLCVPLQH